MHNPHSGWGKAKEDLFNDSEHGNSTVKKITTQHDGLIKEYKAAVREYSETTGGGTNEVDATLDGTNMQCNDHRSPEIKR
jgi:hypothetical protein